MRPGPWPLVIAATFLCITAPAAAGAQGPPATRTGHLVAGTVTDNVGPIPGADVRLVELGRAMQTDAQGRFSFSGVPPGRVTVGVHLQGFSGLHRAVVVPLDRDLVLRLDPDLRFAEEVVVSAAPWALLPLETAQQTDQVRADDVRRDRVASVGEALAKVPGVTFIPTGNALGTPVIRGISENRIRVLNDGVALNHQQFSWRHSPNVEPGFAERVELVRGPASILHGPDAMGGVINLVAAPLPFAADGHRVIRGEFSPGYSTNAGEWAAQGRLEGALGGFGWRANAVRRASDDMTTPRGPLTNTDFAQTNANLTAGYTTGRGSVRARWNHWENGTGFYRPVGFRLDLTDDLLAADAHVATRAGAVETVGSWQRNRRKAYESPGQPATIDLKVETMAVRAALKHRDIGVWRGQAGVEYQRVENRTLSGTLVPDYESDNVAAMVFEEGRFMKTGPTEFHRLVVSAGLRADRQTLDVAHPSGRRTTDYGAVTGTIGLVGRLHETVAVAASLGRGWRAPTAFELHAFGPHGGVSAFQMGNPELREESNLNSEIAVRYKGRLAEGSVTAYRNAIGNYIYLADSGRQQGTLPIFVFEQADATIDGLEVACDVAPLSWLKLGAAWSTVDTVNERTSRRLPQTPADRLIARVEVRRQAIGRLRAGFLAVEGTCVGKGVVSGPDEPLGTPTDAYEVYDLRSGISVPAGRTTLEVSVAVRNLFDREYRDFLWSYKPFAPNPGRDVRFSTSWRF